MIRKLKLFLLALLVPAIALAQSYPSPTFNNVTVQGTLSVSGSVTLYGITVPSTGNFYAGQGASISRISDRLFIAGATANNGTQVASQPDWLTQFQISTGRTGGFIQLASLAVLNGVNPQNNNAFVTATQSQYMNYAGGVIGALAIGVNNNTSYSTSAWGGYNEAYRMSGTTGGAYGLELDTVNYAADTVTDPYQQAPGQVIALQLAAGAELPATGQYPSQAAINIQNNHSTFDTGIVFGSNSLTSGLAIAFSSGQRMQWFGSAGTPTSSIVGTGTTQAAGIQQNFSDNSVKFNNATSNGIFSIAGVNSGVNGLTATGSATGVAPQLSATGSDTNIGIQLSPKGTGGVFANGPTTVTSSATSGNTLALSATSNTGNGAQIFFGGNGATTPNKYLRVLSGHLQCVNSAQSAVICDMDDSGNITFGGRLTSSGIVGTTSGGTPSAGSVGEVISATFSAVSMTNNTAQNLASITLTPGDWDVQGAVIFQAAATTTLSAVVAGISTTSATLPALGNYYQLTANFPTNASASAIPPVQRINVTTNTTVYLVGLTLFGTSTLTSTGFIRARRVD
ncbi:hypothetical protein [Paraburkholderia bannensis]|uniref:hypothetical protein n=1 Tax=Paraburkholderia bannensis TaxID=765414 RepID=UPI00047FA723|nr:hypothetical protein [Paraburkholderia bannensis]